MNPTDQVGIIGFDAAWDWVLPFRPVGNGEWISEKLAALQSDGGTDLTKPWWRRIARLPPNKPPSST